MTKRSTAKKPVKKPKKQHPKRSRGRPYAGGRDPIRTIRAPDDLWQLLTLAAQLVEVSRTRFILDAAARKARRVLRQHDAAARKADSARKGEK